MWYWCYSGDCYSNVCGCLLLIVCYCGLVRDRRTSGESPDKLLQREGKRKHKITVSYCVCVCKVYVCVCVCVCASRVSYMGGGGWPWDFPCPLQNFCKLINIVH